MKSSWSSGIRTSKFTFSWVERETQAGCLSASAPLSRGSVTLAPHPQDAAFAARADGISSGTNEESQSWEFWIGAVRHYLAIPAGQWTEDAEAREWGQARRVRGTHEQWWLLHSAERIIWENSSEGSWLPASWASPLLVPARLDALGFP